MHIIEWNINQATNTSNNNIVPGFVVNEVIKNNPDIFIFTEFAKTRNYIDVESKLKINGFDYAVTNNDTCKQNEVLIAWKDDKFRIDRDKIEKPLAIDDMPEVFIVPLNWMGIKFIVAGLRIKLFNNDYLKRKKQLENVMDLIGKQFSDYKYCIIGGDFNNNKSDYKNCQWRDKWSLGVIDSIAKKNNCIRKTPDSSDGSSIYQKNNYILFQEDHFLVSKGIEVNDVHYCRNFAKCNSDIYLHEEDFQVYNSQLRTVTWTIPFGSGVPDHAMLIADFEMLECEENKDEPKNKISYE